MSWSERHVADQQHDRPVPVAAATPNADRDRAVDPVGAAVGEHGRRRFRWPARTPRRRGSASRRRRTASRRPGGTRPSRAATSGSESSSPSAAAIASTAVVVGGPPCRQPARLDVEALRLREGAPRAACPTTPAGSCHAAVRVERDLRSVRKRRQPAAQRLGRRQIADPEDELGAVVVGERRVAQQQVVVGDRALRRAGRRTAGRRARESRRRAAYPARPSGSGVPAPATISRRPDGCGPGRSPARGGRRRLDDHVRLAVAARRGVRGQGLVEDERLAQREVEVDGARPPLERRPVCAAGQRPDPPQPLIAWRSWTPTSTNHLTASP